MTSPTAPTLDPDRMARNADDAARFLRAIANDSRLMVLCRLVEGEHTVGELQACVPLSQSALSQHLAVLRHEGLVTTRRAAQHVHYSLADERARRLVSLLYELFCSPGG